MDLVNIDGSGGTDGIGDAGLAVATPNLLMDTLHEPPERRARTAAGAMMVALACLGLFGWQYLAPTRSVPEPLQPIAAEHTYTIQQTTRLGDLTVIVGYIAELATRGPLYLFTINPGEQPRPGDVTLDDGDGHQVDVISPAGPMPGTSVRVQTIDVGEKFNKQKTELRYYNRHGRKDL